MANLPKDIKGLPQLRKIFDWSTLYLIMTSLGGRYCQGSQPSSSYNTTHISDFQLSYSISLARFSCCLQYWLGVPLFSTSFSCPVCNGQADPSSDHQWLWYGNGDRILRHNAISDVIFRAAQTAGLTPARASAGLIPNSSSRPTEIYLPAWHNVSLLPWSYMSSVPHKKHSVRGFSISRACTSSWSPMQTNFQPLGLPSLNIDFVPLVAESLEALLRTSSPSFITLGEPSATSRHPQLHLNEATLWQEMLEPGFTDNLWCTLLLMECFNYSIHAWNMYSQHSTFCYRNYS